MRQFNIVVLGASGVGKSALVTQFTHNAFTSSYDPTVEDVQYKAFVVDQVPCTVQVVDTAGAEQFLALHRLHVQEAQGFLLVYSLTNLTSVNELNALWDSIKQIKQKHHIPVVLVGNKSDLRSARTVPREVGTKLSESWENVPYYETSASKRINVDEIFADLVRQIRTEAAAKIEERSSKMPSLNTAIARADERHTKCLVM